MARTAEERKGISSIFVLNKNECKVSMHPSVLYFGLHNNVDKLWISKGGYRFQHRFPH